jgi:hypothetical protein
VEVGRHERGRSIGQRGETTCFGERRLREVHPDHARAEPGQRHCVRPDMALQMDAVETADVAEPRQVEADART